MRWKGNRRHWQVLLSLCVALLLATACSAPGGAAPRLHVDNAWVRPGFAGVPAGTTPTAQSPATSGTLADATTSAVYLVVVNDGGAADTLVGVTSEAAAQADLHQTRIEGNIAMMAPVHGRVAFEPGGYHLMLTGLTRDINVGDSISITLHFETSGDLKIAVPVREGS